MNTKILASLVLIGIAISGITFGTFAYFSDTETSTGNTFTAGKLDLFVDSKCSYNGLPQTPCTWNAKDLTGDLFFNFLDVKPGDYGEDTVSLHVVDNPSCGFVKIIKTADSDVSCNEPELAAETDCLTDPDGELDENLVFTIYKDLDCDNKIDTDDTKIREGTLDMYWALGDLSLDPVNPTCFQIHWKLPWNVGNIVQSDSFKADLIFYAEQKRHQYATCPVGLVQRIESSTFNFGPTGWAGWSCPAGTHIIGAENTCTLPLTISQPAKPGIPPYPNYFHYTYTPPEEGWVLQNGGTSQSCKLIIYCV